MQKSIQISNKYIFGMVLVKMVLVFHCFACLWIRIGNTDDGWRSLQLMPYYQKTSINEITHPWIEPVVYCKEGQEIPKCVDMEAYWGCLQNMLYIYWISFYFVVTNATTIGYGDFYGNTISEMLLLYLL